MSADTIIGLIMALAPVVGVDPSVALAVARVESSLDPQAIGQDGEIGLYQLMPQYVPGYTEKQLRDPVVNIYIGLRRLKESKDTCVHRKGINYLVCYNYGPTNAKRIKYPSKFPYVRKVKAQMELHKAHTCRGVQQ